MASVETGKPARTGRAVFSWALPALAGRDLLLRDCATRAWPRCEQTVAAEHRVLHDDDLAVEAIVDRILERGRLLRLDGPAIRTKHISGDDSSQTITSPRHLAEFPESTPQKFRNALRLWHPSPTRSSSFATSPTVNVRAPRSSRRCLGTRKKPELPSVTCWLRCGTDPGRNDFLIRPQTRLTCVSLSSTTLPAPHRAPSS